VAIADKDIEEGIVYDQNAVRVTAFHVKHANLKDAFGFRVDYRGHAVVISGDMAPNENFIKYAQGADVVIHEVGVARPELLEKDAGVRQIATHHSSPEDAARDFVRIKPKLAVYTHFTRPRRDDIPEVSIAEIISRTRAIYVGPLVAGEDLTSISIGDSVKITRFGDWDPLLDLLEEAVRSGSKEKWQVRPEIDLLLSSVAIKFNFEERHCSRSSCEDSAFNYVLCSRRAKWCGSGQSQAGDFANAHRMLIEPLLTLSSFHEAHVNPHRLLNSCFADMHHQRIGKIGRPVFPRWKRR